MEIHMEFIQFIVIIRKRQFVIISTCSWSSVLQKRKQTKKVISKRIFIKIMFSSVKVLFNLKESKTVRIYKIKVLGRVNRILY